MICSNCQKGMPDNTNTFPEFSGESEQEKSKRTRSPFFKHILKAFKTILLIYVFVWAFFGIARFINSPAILDFKFTAAVKTGNYEKALSYTDAVDLIEPQELKYLDLDLIPAKGLNHYKSSRKVLNVFTTYKIGLSDIVRRGVGFYLPENSKLYFDGKEIKDISTYYDDNDTFYFIGNSIYGVHRIKVEHPLFETLNTKVLISPKFDEESLLDKLELTPKHNIKISANAQRFANYIFQSASKGIEFKDLEFPEPYTAKSHNFMDLDYSFILIDFEFDDDNYFVQKSNTRITDIKFSDSLSANRNSLLSVDATVYYTYKKVYVPGVIGDDEGKIFNSHTTYRIYFKLIDGNWEADMIDKLSDKK